MKLPALIMARTRQALHTSEVLTEDLLVRKRSQNASTLMPKRPLESVRQRLQQDQYQTV